MEDLNMWLIGGGLAVGAVFGYLVHYFRYCMVAATGNLFLIGDNRMVLAFVAALAVAIGGTQYLEFSDTVAIADSSYRNALLDWFGASLGGFIFGIGSVFAGGCATRTLVRSAEGSMNAIVALIFFMLLAASAQFGFLEGIRLSITSMTATELTGSDAGLAALFSLPAWLPAVVAVVALLAYMVFRWNPDARGMVIGGVIIGTLVIASWYITGVLAQDEFDPTRPSAITVSGPMARFGYILLSGKIPDFSFTIAFVIGIFVTVLLVSMLTGKFKLEKLKPGQLKNAAFGGSLMGIGAIMAYGCNVGQGLSGVSTLSLESVLAFAGMFSGTALTVKWMEKYRS